MTVETDDTANKIIEIQKYMDSNRNMQEFVLEFIRDDVDNFVNLQSLFEFKNIGKIRVELKLFLDFLNKISKNHRRRPDFSTKIKKIILYFEKNIKNFFSNVEIFDIFKDNKQLLIFLQENNLLTIDKHIIKLIKIQRNVMENIDGMYICYFYPELLASMDKYSLEEIENTIIENTSNDFLKKERLNGFVEFKKNRQIGENESYICQLIRDDCIDDFVTYINQKNINVKNYLIKTSIFETNSFLMKNKSTKLIEYAAFFGSIQIFNYLRFNNIILTSSLWLYAIHGGNADMIHLLESIQVQPKDVTFYNCFIEAIKCHENGIADYIQNNFLTIDFEQITNNVYQVAFECFNFYFYPEELSQYILDLLCKYGYNEMVENFLVIIKSESIPNLISKKKIFNYVSIFVVEI